MICRRTANHRRGFTLVELLVVIGIIALLISILMPALSRARAQAQQTQCLSNERQVGMGMIAFAIDHLQHVPLAGSLNPAGGGSGTPQSLNDPSQRYWSYVMDGGVPHVMPLEAALAPYLGMS
ncbi:MAG TPA: type II secretion system protein, partial [Tepidisphaeraceae bacterium]